MRGLARAIAFCAVWLFGAVASAQDPFIGTWQLSGAKSNAPRENPTFTPLADGQWEWTSEAEGDAYRFRMDGKPVPHPRGGMIAWKQIEANIWESIWNREGRPATEYRWRLAEDGQVLVRLAVSPDRYHRVAGSAGLAGKWKWDITSGGDISLNIQADGADGWVMTEGFSSLQYVCKAKFDGKEYPTVGPKGDAMQTLALKRTGTRTVEIRQTNVKGQSPITHVYTVSEDGKTLTRVWGDAKNPNVMAYQRH